MQKPPLSLFVDAEGLDAKPPIVVHPQKNTIADLKHELFLRGAPRPALQRPTLVIPLRTFPDDLKLSSIDASTDAQIVTLDTPRKRKSPPDTDQKGLDTCRRENKRLHMKAKCLSTQVDDLRTTVQKKREAARKTKDELVALRKKLSKTRQTKRHLQGKTLETLTLGNLCDLAQQLMVSFGSIRSEMDYRLASNRYGDRFLVCPICIQELCDVALLCGHIFCKVCIDKLVRYAPRPKCPLCKVELKRTPVTTPLYVNLHALKDLRGPK